MTSSVFPGPILTHELVRPRGLPHLVPREEFGHHRFDIDHGRAIDSVELGNIEAGVFHAEYAADGASEAIGPVLAPLRENSYGRPVRIVPGMAGAGDDLRRFDLMKEEQDLDMGEFSDACESFGRKTPRELDAGFLSAPEVVLRVGANGAYEAHGFECRGHMIFIFSCRLSKMELAVRLTDERGKQDEVHVNDALPEDGV